MIEHVLHHTCIMMMFNKVIIEYCVDTICHNSKIKYREELEYECFL
jgi:hypothetical protein